MIRSYLDHDLFQNANHSIDHEKIWNKFKMDALMKQVSDGVDHTENHGTNTATGLSQNFDTGSDETTNALCSFQFHEVTSTKFNE